MKRKPQAIRRKRETWRDHLMFALIWGTSTIAMFYFAP